MMNDRLFPNSLGFSLMSEISPSANFPVDSNFPNFPDFAFPSFGSQSAAAGTSLLFIDPGVANYQTLLNGVTAGTEVHILDSTQDAIAQITQTLLGRSGISSLHILSHGASGNLQLGPGGLNLANLPFYASQLQSWRTALTEDADILLYGCNVAQNELGQAFVQILSQLTGADVAASMDFTGSTGMGGNWELEINTGQIETALAFGQDSLAHYQALLPVDQISRVSISTDGTQGFYTNNNAPLAYYQSDISGDGRYAVFSTDAAGLVPGDVNGLYDVFLRDRRTGTTTLISPGNSGAANGNSYSPIISADGNYVVFYSTASNLNARGLPYSGLASVYVYDRQRASLTRIAENTTEAAGNPLTSLKPSISADGRYIAYETGGGVSSGTQPGLGKVHLYDQQTGIVRNIRAGRRPSISADGRYIAFQEDFDAYVRQLFLYEVATGTLTVISAAPGPNRFSKPSLSADGRYMVFESNSDNLVPGDTNFSTDIFVYDRDTKEISRVSLDSNGNQGNDHSFVPTISADGRYVAFHSWANNLVPGDTNGSRDVFVHDRQTGQTTRVSIGKTGEQSNGHSFEAEISADGRHISFGSEATNLVEGDTNGARDIFVVDLIAKPPQREDYDGDGLPDLLWRNQSTGAIVIRTAASGFNQAVSLPNLPSNWQLEASLDFDGDGDLDLLWREPQVGYLSLWELQGTRFIAAHLLPSGLGPSWQIVTVANLDTDANLEILWRNPSYGYTTIWKLNQFSYSSTYNLSSGVGADWSIAAVTDFDQDGQRDLLWRNPSYGYTVIWKLNHLTFDSLAILSTGVGADWQIATVADLDADTNLEILWRNPTYGYTAIWKLNQFAYSTGSLLSNGLGADWTVAKVANFDNTPGLEILWRNSSVGYTGIWVLNHLSYSAGFSLPQGLGADWWLEDVIDTDGDQRLDLVWRQTSGQTVYWLLNGPLYRTDVVLPYLDPNWELLTAD